MEQKLSNRQHNILSYIRKLNKIKVNDLCIELKISDKTVRNEIKEINKIANDILIKSSNTGIEINPFKKDLIDALLSNKHQNDENMVKKLIKMLLLDELEEDDFDSIADAFYISSSTLTKIIKAANDSIERFELKIIRKKNQLVLLGSDYDKRRLLVSMVFNDNAGAFGCIEITNDIFDAIDTKYVSEVVEKTINDYGFIIPNYYLTSFMINIFTILVLPNNEISDKLSSIVSQNTIEMQIADKIIDNLELKKSYYLQSEIANSLIGIINHNRGNLQSLSSNITSQFSNLITNLLKQTFNHFKIEIDFENFIPVFINHTYLMIQRAKNNYSSYLAENEISLKDSCLYIYDIALYFCNLLSEEFNIDVSEAEVSLIAIHIGYSIEESYSNQNKINIALITDQYDMVDNYITQKINTDFYGKINVLKYRDISEFNLKADLYITTRNIPSLKLSNQCVITPLLTNHDKTRIQTSILEAINRKSREKFKILADRYFNEELFFYNEKLCDKESVLEFLDLKLQRKGIVDDKFFDQIKKREELSPTCFMKEFAIPHPFACTALKSRIAVFINPKGILWNQDDYVQFVFLVAICNEDQLTLKDVFDNFASVLCDEAKMLQLKKVKKFEDFFNVIVY